MSDWLHGVKVPPLQIAQLRNLATMVRRASRLGYQDPFPVMLFLEHSLPQALTGFDFTIVDQLPDDDEACAYPDGCEENPEGPFIKLSTLVYEGASLKGSRYHGRYRLTVMHECSHVILHRKVAVHHRNPRGAELKPYENSEWQANQLAAEFLMPPAAFLKYATLEEFCKGMGVSREAALLRAKKLLERKDLANIDWFNQKGGRNERT